MERNGEPARELARRRWAGFAIRAAVSVCAVLALRWPLPVFLASLRGEGRIDGTIGAFLSSFALGALGLPGFFAALWIGRQEPGTPAPWWIRGGLVATLASAVTTAAWIGVSVREIGVTLPRVEVFAQSVPVVVTAIAAVALRIHVARVTSH